MSEPSTVKSFFEELEDTSYFFTSALVRTILVAVIRGMHHLARQQPTFLLDLYKVTSMEGNLVRISSNIL